MNSKAFEYKIKAYLDYERAVAEEQEEEMRLKMLSRKMVGTEAIKARGG